MSKKIDGIFEGGGTLGSAYIGALRCLEDNNIWFKTVSGNSAGAITASLIAVGYTAKELHWLSSSTTITKPSFFNGRNLEAIDFASFLDFPKKASDISDYNKKRTFLWCLLKGEMVDIIKNMEIDGFPTRRKTTSHITDKIFEIVSKVPLVSSNIKDTIYDIVYKVLKVLPDSKPKIKSYIPFDTSDLREKFANKIWEQIVNNTTLYPIVVNLIYEGAICEGDVFFKTIKKLLKEKSGKDDIKFEDLNIPLVLIASDTKHKKMIVYSAKTTPSKSVAHAVRESMSIPFIFEPMGNNQILDGGLCSNYPYWIYAKSVSNKYFDVNDIDNSRVKIGFKLDEELDIKHTWDVLESKYILNNHSHTPDNIDVLKEVLRYKGMISENSLLDIDIDFLKNFSFLLNIMETGSKKYFHESLANSKK